MKKISWCDFSIVVFDSEFILFMIVRMDVGYRKSMPKEISQTFSFLSHSSLLLLEYRAMIPPGPSPKLREMGTLKTLETLETLE